MSTEENKAIVRRWSEELWGRGNLAVADEIVAPGYVRHDPGDPFPAHGPEDVKRIVTMLRAMLPDLEIVVEDMIAAEDKVVSRYTSIATDTEGFMGRPPTGRVIRTPAIQIFRFAPTARSSRAGPCATTWAPCANSAMPSHSWRTLAPISRIARRQPKLIGRQNESARASPGRRSQPHGATHRWPRWTRHGN